MNANHVMGNSWGPIEYRETGLYNFNTKFPSVDTVKSMSCFSDFNHTGCTRKYLHPRGEY